MHTLHPHPSTGQPVRFRVRDLHLPEPGAVLEQLHADDVLEGTVIDVSEGAPGQVFAIVRVDGLRHPVVVAARRILGAAASTQGGAR